MQTLNFECLECEIAQIQESFTACWKMSENGSPDELPSSREGSGDPATPLEHVDEVQKAPDPP